MCIRDRYNAGIDWENLRKQPATFFHEGEALKDEFDTSKFEKSYKKYDETEKLNPFYSSNAGTSTNLSSNPKPLNDVRYFHLRTIGSKICFLETLHVFEGLQRIGTRETRPSITEEQGRRRANSQTA
eukprot:TRINITY_DN6644_c0_g1_i3.p1 TRINITY_DN6644_c0_g1~~TRINITY_DN6644_c0_g1_i3.p1  ORF type:complete len:127 (-),score=17.97 TRINITY_DN6644_c0_g1_i3:167-547(-)